jgi:hypothetical protein
MTQNASLKESRIHFPPLRTSAILLMLGLMVFFFWPRTRTQGVAPLANETFHSQNGLMTIPESERPLDFAVIGVDAESQAYFLLPNIKSNPALLASRYQQIREQLYWLNFELCHGRILNAFPAQTKLYVALPDPEKVKDATGKEERYFLDYVHLRCGWTEDQIKNRIRFFNSPIVLTWAQDIGKILGRDEKGRWVIFRGPQDISLYRQAIVELCSAFPDQFAYQDLPNGVSAEGGDEDLVRTPDGNQLLILGRHRALKYMNIPSTPSTSPGVSRDQLFQDQNVFSKAFDGLPVSLLPTGALVKPALGNDELFHLDMSTAVVGMAREAQAFVPTYLANPVDRMSGQPLDADFVKSVQGELDMIAAELEAMGYKVHRLPFGDHPVRSPANMVRFYDPEKGRCEVMLAKYPVHMNEGQSGSVTPQEQLKGKLSALQAAAQNWQDKPSDTQYQALMDAFTQVWAEMDSTDKEPNPLFDQWVKTFNQAGIDVIPVSDYAWGAGGLHCQVLR